MQSRGQASHLYLASRRRSIEIVVGRFAIFGDRDVAAVLVPSAAIDRAGGEGQTAGKKSAAKASALPTSPIRFTASRWPPAWSRCFGTRSSTGCGPAAWTAISPGSRDMPAGRLDATAGAYTGSELTGNCRLSWYDHMLRNPLQAPAEAEEFTRELHKSIVNDPSGLGPALAMAAEKLDLGKRKPRGFVAVHSPQEALEVVKQSLVGRRPRTPPRWPR